MSDALKDRWISLEEACEYLGVTRQTLLCWIRTKSLPASKAGKLWKLKINEIDEWVRAGGAKE